MLGGIAPVTDGTVALVLKIAHESSMTSDAYAVSLPHFILWGYES